jgi:predicted branched-subunit amino acid permease
MAALGAMGALLRLLISDEEHSWVVWVRRTMAGAIIGIIAYFAVHGLVPPIYEAVIYSVCGTFAPEVVEVVRRRVLRIK